MQNKKKLLFIIWSFSYGGGAEKILANIVNHMDYEKYDIEILEYLHSDKPEAVDPHVKLLPPVMDATKKSLFRRGWHAFIDRILMKLCPSLVRKAHLNRTYDVEISFNYLIPTFLLSRRSQKRIAWIHSSVYDLEENRRQRQRQARAFRDIDTIVPISETTRESLLTVFPECADRLLTIYNGYDFQSMIPDGDTDDFDLLFCNRLDENKDPLRFIRLFKQLRDTGIPVTGKILGTGALREAVIQSIRELGLEDCLEYVGYKKNPYAYFARCRVFCLTSYIEGFPTTLVEAMHFGKPFLSTPVAGTKELAQDGICGVVAADDAAYIAGLTRLLTDAAVYDAMSRACRESVESYSIENQIRAIEACLEAPRRRADA